MTYTSFRRTFFIISLIFETFVLGYTVKMLWRCMDGAFDHEEKYLMCMISVNPRTTGDRIFMAAVIPAAVIIIITAICIGKHNFSDWNSEDIANTIILFLAGIPVGFALLSFVPGLLELIPLF